jgi:bacterioferritin
MAHFVHDVEEIRARASRKIEEGAVTESLRGDVEKTIQILNEALATEIVCVLRYMHHYFMSTGVHGSAVSGEFKEHADAERMHADSIAERIQQLGGKPDYNPRSLLERSVTQYVEGETLADMIREDLIAERIVIEVYHEMVRYFGNNDPTTRKMIEEILADEEEHASDLSDLLYIVEPSTGETQGEDPGADPLHLSEGRSGGRSEGRRQPRSEKSQGGNRQSQAASQRGSAATTIANKPARTQPRQPRQEGQRDQTSSVRETFERGGRESNSTQPAADGRRNRNQQPPADSEGGELHSGQQLGATRAVRVTRPNRKKRVA